MGQVLSTPELTAALERQRARGARIVLTNGVFDLLHVGHLRSLAQARALGDLLVVGVNSDASVRRLKPGRPLVPEAERAELLAALVPVDYVVVFDEPTAERLVELVAPDVYAKGGDYTAESLPELGAVRAAGAALALLPLVANHSTSRLLAQLRASAELP
ncbi:MAG: adenylyltransferase/cytidyltransferase family protein [Chloroflexi bacterium]|nr:adenylyltransferase/cytidyltransferase family protein [Chloroflexota bacterium]